MTWWLVPLVTARLVFNTTCQQPVVIPEELNKEGLRFYWYDLPEEYNAEVMRYWNTKSGRHGYGCDVGCSVCDERRWGNRGVDMAIRQQGAGIAVLAKLAGLGAVEDPREADFFVVPALTHLLWNSGWHWLIGTNETKITSLFTHLTHFNDTTKARHLFIGGDEPSLHPLIRRQPLVIHLGPRIPQPYTTPKGVCYPGRPWHIVVPDPQITAFTQHNTFTFNTHRPYWVFYFGAMAEHLPARNKAIRELLDLNDSSVKIHLITPVKRSGKIYTRHYALHKNKALLGPHEVREYFNTSQFCLVMSGDIPHQTRYFEAVLHGCVPVVVGYRKGGRESWWRDWTRPNETSSFGGFDPAYPGNMQDSYPFTDIIPYKSFTVVVPYDVFQAEGIVPTLRGITPQKYEELVTNLLAHRPSLTYDMVHQGDVTRLVVRRLVDIRSQLVHTSTSGLIPCVQAQEPSPFPFVVASLLITCLVTIFALFKVFVQMRYKRKSKGAWRQGGF